jgi:group I intron endonuclease
MTISGIYKIQSKIHPERIYIGSAVNIGSRKIRHLGDLRKNRHPNSKLQAHYNKHGENDLVFSVVIVCGKEELRPINGIIRPEQFFMWAYDPWFNISIIAGSPMTGRKHSEDTIKKCKENTKLKGNKLRVGIEPVNKGKKGQIPWNKGLTKETNETIRLISEKNKNTGFKKGMTPWNKGKKVGKGSSTSFKKGFPPWNKGLKTGKQDKKAVSMGIDKMMETKRLKKQLKQVA